MSDIPIETLEQLQDLRIDRQRALIISDADEVLLRFMERLEHFLEQQGLWIDLSNFAISGNIKSRTTNEVVSKPNLIDDFFDSETRNIAPVKGAAAALQKLSQKAQIVILTNLPLAAKPARLENMAAHGMDYPIIAGSGLKGENVAWLADKTDKAVFFLDDIPHNINSAATHAPQTHRIHFIADPRLAALVGAAEHASARIDAWDEAYDWINAKLDGA